MTPAPSPDTSTGPRPDVLPHHDPPRIEGMPEFLQLEKLSKLVGSYEGWREDKRDPTTGEVDEVALKEEVDHDINELLEKGGFCVDPTKQTAAEKADYTLAREVLLEVMKSTEDEWRGHATPDLRHHDGVKNQVFERLLDRYNVFPPVDVVPPKPPQPPQPPRPPIDLPPTETELQEKIHLHKDELEKAQLRYSKRLAERSKRMMLEMPHTIAEMAAAREDIAGYIETLAAEMMEDFESQGIPYDKRVDMVGAFIDAEMAATVKGMEAVRANDFRKRNKVVRRGLETWASWATPTVEREDGESHVHHFGRSVLKSLTTLNTWKKGGVFMALGAGVGALTVPLAGLIGGGAFVVGGATLLARQIARGLAGAKLDSVAGAETIAKKQADEMLFQMAEDSEHADTTHDDLLELAADMAEKYRKHNRNRLLGGIGISLAVGGGLGSLINNFVDMSVVHEKINEVMQNIFGHGGEQGSVVPTPGPSSGGTGSGTGGPGGMVGGELPSDKPDLGGAHQPETGPTKGEILKDYLKEHGAARRIDGGEGWLQTFKELGMSPSERRAFLEEYGDDLLRKFPEVTYEMDNGEPGILMTNDGKMPPEVLKYIVEHADKENYINLPTEAEVPTDSVDTTHRVGDIAPQDPGHEGGGGGTDTVVPTAEAANKLINSTELVPANTVSKGESFTRTLNELKKAGVIDVPSEQYAALLKNVGPKLAGLKYPDGTPVAYPNRFPPYDWRLNKSPSGRLHAAAIRKIEQAARALTQAKAA